MHELSVCSALIGQVEAVVRQQAASKVAKIVLRIGPLSGVEPDLRRQACPLAAAGTVLAHAELVIETADVIVRCCRCDSQSRVTPNRMLCSACGESRTRVISGDEMTLRTIELENCANAGHAERDVRPCGMFEAR